MDAIYKKDVVIFNNNFYEQEIMQVLGSKYDLSHVPALTLGVPTSHFLPRSLPAHTELATEGVLALASVFPVAPGVVAI